MEEKEISVQEILGILLAHIRLIVIVTVVAGVAGYSYAKFVLPLQYTSSIKIYVTNGVRNSNDDDDENPAHLRRVGACLLPRLPEPSPRPPCRPLADCGLDGRRAAVW